MKSAGRKWTEEEDSELIRLSLEGKSVITISLIMNRSKSAVIARRNKYKDQLRSVIKKRRENQSLDESKKDEVVSLYRDQFHTISEVARMIGTTDKCVREVLRERNVPVTKRRIKVRIDRDTLQKAIDSGEFTLNSLAKHFNISYGSLLKNIAAQNIDTKRLRKTNREEWTTKEIARLKELVESNMLFWEIGQELGRSAISCRTKAYSLGLSVRRDYDLGGKRFYREDGTRVLFWTKEEEQELERLYASGMLIAEIGQELGRSYASIQKKLSYMGLFQKYEAEREEVYARAFEQIAKGGENNG